MNAQANAGLYVHIPFCSAVCPYCDFAVSVGNAAKRANFVGSLLAEIELCSDWQVPIDTVYFGGGTPSALNPEQLQTILTGVQTSLPLVADYQLFFEANPEDVNASALAAWHDLGVRRLSLGVQSFVDSELRSLGRRHTSTQAYAAVEAALAAGFDTVSVDIMFGLPGQTRDSLQTSLDAVTALAPQHVSCYQLTIHQGTTFARWRERGKLTELDEDNQAELYAQVHQQLASAGLCAYEVSNFAREKADRSSHNLKYWGHVPYLGIGPSAHSFDGHRRWWNLRDFSRYDDTVKLGERPIDEIEQLSAEDLALEALMLGIRTADGICLTDYQQRYGVALGQLNARLIDQLVADGYLSNKPGWITPTQTGLSIADGLAAQFELSSRLT